MPKEDTFMQIIDNETPPLTTVYEVQEFLHLANCHLSVERNVHGTFRAELTRRGVVVVVEDGTDFQTVVQGACGSLKRFMEAHPQDSN